MLDKKAINIIIILTLGINDREGFGNKKLAMENVRSDT